MSEAVAITGWGAVSALGVGRAALWPALRDGRTGIRAIERFSTEALTVHRGGCVPGYDAPDESPAALCDTFSWLAAEEALRHAGRWGCPLSRADGARAALVFGTSIIVDTTLERPAARLAEKLGLGGPVFTVSTACTSSTYAIGLARDLLLDERQGVDLVLAGGADVLTIELQAGFHALGVLTRETCQPFGRVKGTSLGEGAGFVVLERRAQAKERTRATLLGYGLSGDAYHETSPEPRGRGVLQATRAALRDARVDVGSVRYVNLHGTGTEANDPAECMAMREVFGAEGVERALFSSTKGHLGHAQGAAGVLELVATLEALEHGHFPGTAGLDALRPSVNLPVLSGARVAVDPSAPFVSCNSAFAGSNAALVVAHGSPLGAGESASPAPAHPRLPPLFVHGVFVDVAERHLTELRAPARADTRGHDRATQPCCTASGRARPHRARAARRRPRAHRAVRGHAAAVAREQRRVP
ncbi:MAG: beta-ketoacyl-[acyl-carrier-protein] synthase family protein [Sandaracinaceae bacterium]|nr:beta-ketoacyl-[acyl-carrier-protein] synthase family protein [Sandaracinaceae bacterium]